MANTVAQIWRTALPRESRLRASRTAVCVLFFLNGMLFATWASRIASLKSAHEFSNGQLGIALLAMSLGAVIAMPLSGKLIIRFGSAMVCRAGAIVYGLMLPVAAIAPGQIWFSAALFCFGVGHAALDVAMNAQAVAVEGRYQVPIMSSFHALWSFGGLTGAALGGLQASHLSPLVHFMESAILFGIGASMVCPMLVEDHTSSESPATANSGRLPGGFVLTHPRILALGLVALCVMIGEGAMADWSAVFLRNNIGAREELAAAGYASFSVAMAVGRLLGDRMILRFGPVTMVRLGGLMAAAGLTLALVSGQIPFILAGFAFVGLGFATVVPIVFSAAGNIPELSAGAALSSVTTTGYLGFLIGPPLIGFVAESVGLALALAMIVLTSIAVFSLAGTVRTDFAAVHK